MEIIGYFSAIFIGFSLGLIGGGGSILTVPALVYLMGIDPIQASGYSLFIVGLTALIGSLNYFRKNEVDVQAGLLFSLPSFLGVYTSRVFIIPNLPTVILSIGNFQLTKSVLIMFVFSVLMLMASINMVRGQKTVAMADPSHSNKKNLIVILGLGFSVGSVAGFVGAGGGFLIIPALIFLVQMSMRTAIGTSLMIIAIQSLLGFVSDMKNQQSIDWSLLCVFAVIAIFGLFFGMKISNKISERNLKKIFGYFVMVLGAVILFDQFRKL